MQLLLPWLSEFQGTDLEAFRLLMDTGCSGMFDAAVD
jgi:hypothetical protein